MNNSIAPKIKKKERSRQKIINSTIEILAKKGFEATSFQNIADHCDMTQQGVLVHFKNRNDLFLGVLVKIQEEMYQEVDGLISEEDSFSEKLEKHFQANYIVIKKHPERMQVFILLYYYASFDPEFRKLYKKILKRVHERIMGYESLESDKKAQFRLPIHQIVEVFHAFTIGFLINLVAGELGKYNDASTNKMVGSFIGSLLLPRC